MDEHDEIKLNTFIGQKTTVDSLKISIEAARLRNESLDHILLVGERGSGKNTLVNAIAHETGAVVKATSFHALKKESELCAVLTSLGPGDILLIDHFDSIKVELLNPLCSAMEEFYLDVVIGKGSSAKSVRLDLPYFTLIGVTENEKNLPKKILDCFPIIARLGKYNEEELVLLSKATASRMQVEITDEAACKIAAQADGSYRKLTNY